MIVISASAAAPHKIRTAKAKAAQCNKLSVRKLRCPHRLITNPGGIRCFNISISFYGRGSLLIRGTAAKGKRVPGQKQKDNLLPLFSNSTSRSKTHLDFFETRCTI